MEKIKLYLASRSPQRKKLLKQLLLPFSVLHPSVEEQQMPNENPVDYVRRLSFEKALAGVSMAPQPLPVLGADTLIVCDGEILEKPQDKKDSFRMLSLLSGREHQVLTALTLADKTKAFSRLVTTNVFFKPLTHQEIDAYWQTGEPQDKAGSYAIQGRGARFVMRIEGSYHAVVGLPLYEMDALFTEFEQSGAKDL